MDLRLGLEIERVGWESKVGVKVESHGWELRVVVKGRQGGVTAAEWSSMLELQLYSLCMTSTPSYNIT